MPSGRPARSSRSGRPRTRRPRTAADAATTAGTSAAAGAADAPGASADPWRIAAALVTAPTLEQQLSLLLEEAPRIGAADSATAYLLDDATGDVRVAALYGQVAARAQQPRPHGLTRHVLETGETLVIQDTSADPRINPVVPQSGIQSVMALPLVARRDRQDARPTGVLYVNARRPNAFTPAVIQALTGLAALAAVAIENTLLLESQRDAAGRLEDALRLREQFVSLASHELKEPLTPLKGYAQAIARRLDTAARAGQAIDEAWLRRALSVMVGQIDRLDRLITDLLDVTRVRAGRFTLQPEPADLIALARETFDRFRGTITAEASTEHPGVRHDFSWRSEAGALPGVWDRTRLDQLLTNLLSNAVKYSPQGGTVELSVGAVATDEPALGRLRDLAAGVVPAGGWVHLSVRDEGVGLAGADTSAGVAHPTKSRIFEAFSRGESAATSEASGFGLGLFICAEIARRHGGAIWAESPGPNQGTTFHVLLPPEPTAPPASSAEPEPAGPEAH